MEGDGAGWFEMCVIGVAVVVVAWLLGAMGRVGVGNVLDGTRSVGVGKGRPNCIGACGAVGG